MTGYRIVVRWDGLLRKGYIQVADTTRHLTKPLTWAKFFDLWYIPEVRHLEVRDQAGDGKRELTADELATIAKHVREIGAQLRPIEDML